ncbi:putative sigma factor sigb regulation protein rsbq [Tripterygium wilfordii]|uniref:Putative sigma factor sigb regulation protein rsbq n=1 Tax=Tripterygium wilfordii TaxID=458696 RepID=A0A7J7DWF9_TRIWF|nr:strigolactone esterase D14-like [Tripterygium wilfordii]KAF5750633.1 putative sigma factor sigb regulation protein rsbq [Tripterygium wilfordii]
MDALCDHGEGIVEALNAKFYGNGTETLVLSHGFGTDQSVWHYLIPYLACYFKVLVFDLIFGPNVNPDLYNPSKYSNFSGYAKDLMCLLDELNVSRSIYIGHSMSAMIGCIAATKRPHLFQQLMLLSGSPRYLNAEGYKGGFERFQLNAIFKAMNQNYSSWFQTFAPTAVAERDTAAIAEFEYSLGRMNPRTALSVAKTVFLSDLRRILPQVQVPCTIIQSRKDNMVPQNVCYYMKKKVGGHTRVNILNTQGHFPQLTAHPLLLEVLKRALHIE